MRKKRADSDGIKRKGMKERQQYKGEYKGGRGGVSVDTRERENDRFYKAKRGERMKLRATRIVGFKFALNCLRKVQPTQLRKVPVLVGLIGSNIF